MSQKTNTNQTQLDIIDIGEAIETQKRSRRKKLKKTFFNKNQLSLDNLIKLTFDISDKDFEYLYAELLERQGYSHVDVIGGENDGGVDIRAYNSKEKIWYFIQCKQWSSLYLDVGRTGEFYAKLYSKKKTYPNAKFRVVTTSYFDNSARQFLHNHGLEYIDNISLIKLCEEFDIFETGKWQEIRMKIYKKRLEKIKDEINPKETLKNELKIEITHHLPEEIRYKSFPFLSQKTRSYVGEFFQIIDSI